MTLANKQLVCLVQLAVIGEEPRLLGDHSHVCPIFRCLLILEETTLVVRPAFLAMSIGQETRVQ